MQSLIPVELQIQDIPESTHAELSSYICKEIDDALQARAGLEQKWKQWFRQWEGQLKRPDKRDDSYVDLDIPTTRERGQQALARILNPIMQEERLFSAKPREPDFDEFRKAAEDFLDFQCDQWDVSGTLFEVGKNALIYTTGFIKDSWTHTTKSVAVMQPDMMTGALTQTQQRVDDKLGVFPRAIPTENLIVPANARDLQSSPWVAEHLFLSDQEIKRNVAQGGWLDAPLGTSDDDTELKQEKAKVAGIDYDEERTKHLYEWYGLWDWNNDGVDEELVVWIDKQSGHIFRAIENFYSDYKRPYLGFQWEPIYDSVYGRSFCQILESVHRAISAYFMIRLEAAALAARTAFGTSDIAVASQFKNRAIANGEVIHLPDGKDSIWDLPLVQTMSELPRLLEELERHADRLAGITDYNMGNESISRPTASGQVALIEEGKQPLYLKLDQFRRFLAQLGLRILVRYKQFYPDRMPYFSMNKSGQLVSQLLQFPPGMIEDQLIIEPKASSAALNENVRKQEIVGLMEQMRGYYNQITPLLQLATTPSPVQMAAVKEVGAMQAMMNRVLDVFRIPQPEQLSPNFEPEVMAGAQLALQLMQAQAAGMGGPGPGGVPGEGAGQAPAPGGLENGQGVAGGPPAEGGQPGDQGREPRAYHRSAGLPRPQ